MSHPTLTPQRRAEPYAIGLQNDQMTRQVRHQIGSQEARQYVGDLLSTASVGNSQDQDVLGGLRRKAPDVGEIQITRYQNRIGFDCARRNALVGGIAEAAIAYVVDNVAARTQNRQCGTRHVGIKQKFHAARAGSGCSDSSPTRALAYAKAARMSSMLRSYSRATSSKLIPAARLPTTMATATRVP